MKTTSHLVVGVMITHLLLTLSMSIARPDQPPKCKLFVFGDSNSDVGGSCAAMGTIPRPLMGRKPSCRASDGLLYTDFVCASLGMKNFVSPYLESLGSDFTNGANFAISAMTARELPNVPYPLAVQVRQFARFKDRVEQLKQEGKGPAISDHDFENAIFTLDIGQNDLGFSLFSYNYTDLTTHTIPEALKSIENATKTLYSLGARKLVLFNTGPLGCLPFFLGGLQSRGLHLDGVGCIREYNEIAMQFNFGLASLANLLRSEMMGATVVYIDMYTIKYEVIANATKYGLERPLEACYKFGTVCVDPSRAVSWDGIHYAEAANKIIASRIEGGHDAVPFTPFEALCELVVKKL